MSGQNNVIKWNSNQIVSFFNIYKNYTCLWDTSSEDYLKRDKRQIAMKNLAVQLEVEGFGVLPVEVLKSKIKSVKDSYRFELNKVKKSMKSGAGSEAVYTPKLSWFSVADAFLRKVFLERQSSSNLDLSVAHEEGDISGRSKCNSLESKVFVDTQSYRPSTAMPPYTPTQAVRPKSSMKMHLPTHSSTRLVPVQEASNRLGRKFKPTRLKNSIEKIELIARVPAVDPDDQFEKYGRYIASQLREIPLRSFLHLQHKINNLITTERINLFDSSIPSITHTRSPSPQDVASDSSLSFQSQSLLNTDYDMAREEGIGMEQTF